MIYADELRQILDNSNKFIKSVNYYFQNHDCEVLNKTVKVKMKYNIFSDDSEKILRIGRCSYCNKCYYAESYREKDLI